MICYYHTTRLSVGTCRHCGRGLCSECASLVEDSLACRDRHEQAVGSAQQARRWSNLQSERIGSVYVRNAVFYGAVGAAFVALGGIQFRFLGVQALFFLVIGALLVYAAIANYLESRKFR